MERTYQVTLENVVQEKITALEFLHETGGWSWGLGDEHPKMSAIRYLRQTKQKYFAVDSDKPNVEDLLSGKISLQTYEQLARKVTMRSRNHDMATSIKELLLPMPNGQDSLCHHIFHIGGAGHLSSSLDKSNSIPSMLSSFGVSNLAVMLINMNGVGGKAVRTADLKLARSNNGNFALSGNLPSTPITQSSDGDDVLWSDLDTALFFQ